MSIVAESFHSMAQTIDPDVQATLSDFLTYTEHFPSYLTRALTLIDAETKRADEKIAAIHSDTTTYGFLPTLDAGDREDPAVLRARISHALGEVERAGRMRLAEATRLAETATRENARLDLLVRKLKQMPLPSRDPTPEESTALTSPNLGRTARFGVDASPDKVNRRLQDKAVTKIRARKITVPGEVLPPPDPDAPLETMSDWSSSRSSPDFDEVMRRKEVAARPRSRTPKPPRMERAERMDREKKIQRPRGPRQPGQPGTNAHSAVAGISTSNALLALNPPPADAIKGSRWLPWMKLTEWEMATLRKRMKKNAIWVPSATMLRRELKDLGRGLAGREEARAAAAATGGQFLDEHNEPDPTRILHAPTDSLADVVVAQPAGADSPPPVYNNDHDEAADAELINRGMRLNEAKKIKRARLVQEQLEAAAQIEREQGDEHTSAPEIAADVPLKKRKRESTPDPESKSAVDPLGTPDPLSKAGPPPRRIRISHTASSRASDGADKLALSVNDGGPSGTNSSTAAAAASNSRHTARASERRKFTASPVPEPAKASRKPTIVLKATKAVSEEPPNRRASLRRSSNASLPSTGTAHANRNATRRSKRPAPGLVTATDNESARVSASRRKAAPRRKGAAPKSQARATSPAAVEPQTEDEQVDPNEPRYCICGDVSWGTMIACDNELSCEKEWFHLECVGLSELPPRRTKWYCPDCRKKLKQGQSTNGLVGRLVAGTPR